MRVIPLIPCSLGSLLGAIFFCASEAFTECYTPVFSTPGTIERVEALQYKQQVEGAGPNDEIKA